MKLTMKFPAPADEGQNSVFAPDAPLNLIGGTTEIVDEGRRIAAKIIDAKVVDEGKSMLLTLEVPDA